MVKKINSWGMIVLAASGLLVAFGPILVQSDEPGGVSTVRVSVDSDGNQATGGNSASPSTSDDGRHVVFQSNAVNLVDDDANGLQDIFVHDRDADGDGIFDDDHDDDDDEQEDDDDDDGSWLFISCFITAASHGFFWHLF